MTEINLRYELKLPCDQHLLPQARTWIRLHPEGFRVAYPTRRVNSLYLDTGGLRSFNETLEGLSTRQKLRLRWYGASTSPIPAYLELKQKHNLLGSKKRVLLPCELDLTASWTETLKKLRTYTDPEWHPILQTTNYPTLLNHYQREYYISHDNTIRVTLDFAQVAYDQRLTLRPNLHARLPIEDLVIIEIKAAQDQLERLREVSAGFPVARARNSKYAQGLRLCAL